MKLFENFKFSDLFNKKRIDEDLLNKLLNLKFSKNFIRYLG